MVKDDLIIELQPNIFRLKGEDTSSHSYLIRGDYKNVLIDSGVDKNFSKLQKSIDTLPCINPAISTSHLLKFISGWKTDFDLISGTTSWK